MKKSVSYLILLVMMIVLLFSGCVSNSTGNTVENDANEAASVEKTDEKPTETIEEKVKLKYWALSRWKGITGTEPDGQYGDWQRDVARRFMENNPNVVDIEVEHIPASDIQQKLTVAIASKTQPDVLEDNDDRGTGFARMGALVPVSDYFTKEEMDDFFEGSWDNGGIKMDGKYYMIPWSNSVQIMLINKTMFEKAGALHLLPNNEEKSWTYDQFKEALKAVTKDNVYGGCLFFGSTAGDAYAFNIIMGTGSRIVNEKGDKLIYNNSKTELGLEFLISLIDEKLVVPGAETLMYSDAKELFKQQKVATTFMGSSGFYEELYRDMDDGKIERFEIDYALFPHAPGETPVLKGNYIGYLVFKSGNAQREKAAVELAKFATNTENSKALKIVKLIPLRKSVGNLYPGDEMTEWSTKIFKYAINHGYACPAYAQIRAAHVPMLQGLATKTTNIKDGLAEFESKIQQEIEQALKQ
ncbi:MAG TPA: sugar ABC transporter substrate-binding protein [Clostridiaceae bacterium]|nr:sugar ABC transporter substrate-binding protein [Clostridiaceae bacterium]